MHVLVNRWFLYKNKKQDKKDLWRINIDNVGKSHGSQCEKRGENYENEIFGGMPSIFPQNMMRCKKFRQRRIIWNQNEAVKLKTQVAAPNHGKWSLMRINWPFSGNRQKNGFAQRDTKNAFFHKTEDICKQRGVRATRIMHCGYKSRYLGVDIPNHALAGR